jgi:hypothetical protein
MLLANLIHWHQMADNENPGSLRRSTFTVTMTVTVGGASDIR